MLSKDEKNKIKLGVKTIQERVPEATMDQAIRMFDYTLGKKLPEADKVEAHEIIKMAFYKYMN